MKPIFSVYEDGLQARWEGDTMFVFHKDSPDQTRRKFVLCTESEADFFIPEFQLLTGDEVPSRFLREIV